MKKEQNSNPRISVLMSTYNQGVYLREAIDSILQQTFSNFEFMITNDGSDDNTDEILQQYSDKRIRIIRNDKSIGLAESLNQMMDSAKGEYIARMDSDDIAHHIRFEKQIEFLEKHPSFDLIGTGFTTFGLGQKKRKSNPSNPKILKAWLLFTNRIAHPTVMFRKKSFETHRLKYNTTFRRSQDYDLWVRASLKLNLTNLTESLLNYRIHKKQASMETIEEQTKLSTEVRKFWFGELDMQYSEQELNAFNRFSRSEKLDNAEIKLISPLFQKIITKNKEKKIFATSALKKVFRTLVYLQFKRASKQNKLATLQLLF